MTNIDSNDVRKIAKYRINGESIGAKLVRSVFQSKSCVWFTFQRSKISDKTLFWKSVLYVYVICALYILSS